MFGGKCYISMSHTLEDAEKTIAAVDEAMAKMVENDFKYVAEQYFGKAEL